MTTSSLKNKSTLRGMGIVSFVVLLTAFLLSDAGIGILVSLLFAADGFIHITLPTLRHAIFSSSSLFDALRSGEETLSAGRCYRDTSSLLQWATKRAQERLLASGTIGGTTPVREIVFHDMNQTCQEAIWNNRIDKHMPFVIRSFGGHQQFEELSAESLLEHFGSMNVATMDMREFEKRASEMAACPHRRKDLSRVVTMKEMSENTHLYANFNAKNYRRVMHVMNMRKSPFSKLMKELRGLCGLFQARFAYGGELFFGWNDPDDPTVQLGTPFHAALGGNLFLQVHGERNWRLVDPAYTKYMFPMHGYIYLFGSGRHRDGSNNLTDPPHWDAIPKLSVTTRPGDILYIPPWWWHEIRIDKPGFTLGLSNREIIRPWTVIGAPLSIDRTFLYLVHGGAVAVPEFLWKIGLLSKDRVRSVRPNIEELLHDKAYP